MTNKSFQFKKLVAAFSVCAVMYACGSAPEENKKPISSSVNPQIGGVKAEKAAAPETSTAPAADSTVAAPVKDNSAAIAAGKKLISGSDCLACHQEKQKLVGPAYADVAKKYKEADVAKLAKKVIDGGMGVWGQVPMSPHPTVTQADAESMIHYILSIK